MSPAGCSRQPDRAPFTRAGETLSAVLCVPQWQRRPSHLLPGLRGAGRNSCSCSRRGRRPSPAASAGGSPAPGRRSGPGAPKPAEVSLVLKRRGAGRAEAPPPAPPPRGGRPLTCSSVCRAGGGGGRERASERGPAPPASLPEVPQQLLPPAALLCPRQRQDSCRVGEQRPQQEPPPSARPGVYGLRGLAPASRRPLSTLCRVAPWPLTTAAARVARGPGPGVGAAQGEG